MKITDDVRAVLERGIKIDGALLEITAQLDRVLYMKVNKVLTALGAKWSRNLKAHVFNEDVGDNVERALVSGEVTTAQDVGFFKTPPLLADRIARFVVPERSPTLVVLEPSAGEGALVTGLISRGVFAVLAIEHDAGRRATLKARFTDLITVAPVGDFMDFDGRTVAGAGSLLQFDAIAANPPFCRVGKGDHVDHLALMLDLLSDTGRLACVMPSSLLFREDQRYAECRRAIAARKGRIEALPALSFKSSGTQVNTCVVLVGKGDF